MSSPFSPPTDELQALRAELASLKGELRVVTVERDLLREKLKAFQRQLFGAKSEARDGDQRDLFLNEAEALAAGSEAAQESAPEDDVEKLARTSARSAGASPWIRCCLARSCAMSCPKPNASALMTARH